MKVFTDSSSMERFSMKIRGLRGGERINFAEDLPESSDLAYACTRAHWGRGLPGITKLGSYSASHSLPIYRHSCDCDLVTVSTSSESCLVGLLIQQCRVRMKDNKIATS